MPLWIQPLTKADPSHRLIATAAVIAGNGVTIAGVLLFGWDALFVLLLMMLGLAASATGLASTIRMHQRTTADPAHLQAQFTGWLRMRSERNRSFHEAMWARTVPFPAALTLFLLLIIVARASAPAHAALVPLLSMAAIAVMAWGETAPLRRDIARVPFVKLRALAITMVYREAVVFVLFFVGLVALQWFEQPLPRVLVVCVLLKTLFEIALLRRPVPRTVSE